MKDEERARKDEGRSFRERLRRAINFYFGGREAATPKNFILRPSNISSFVPPCSFFVLLFLLACSPNPEIPKSPNSQIRLISLAPNLTESLSAIGADSLLVGRTDSCDFPADITRLPSTGKFGEPSIERILALRPTHVVYADLLDKTIPDKLRQYNLSVHHIPCTGLNDIAPALRELGEITDLRGEAEALATKLDTRLVELANEASDTPPGVFLLMWNEPLMTVGRGSFITDLVHLAGGGNVFADVENAYFNVSPELAVSRNPDILLSLVDAPPGTLAPLLAKNPGWAATRAIRENRVIEELPLDIICRPGPRVLEAIEALREALERQKAK